MSRTFAWLTLTVLGILLGAASCGDDTTNATGTAGVGGGGASGSQGGAGGSGGADGGSGGSACDPAKCPAPKNECMDAVCDAEGCGEEPKRDGTLAETQTSGDCKRQVCQGGAVTPEDDESDLPDDGNDCTTDVCTDGVASHPAKPLDSPCGPGGNSFCDGSGTCAVCTQPEQCPGQDTECQARTCDGGTCGVVFRVVGTPTNAQTAGDCKANQCDGSGAIEVVPDDTDPEDDGNPCMEDTCSAGTPVHTPAPLDTPCGTGLKCDGLGACVGCVIATDCPVPTNTCLVATCTVGVCGTVNQTDGTACDDGNACTDTDTCIAGACTGADPVICTALDSCHTAGTCDPTTGLCSNPERPDGTVCNDGNSCTQADACQAGVCTGSNPVICSALDQCHDAGTCDTATGVCSNPNKANGSACNDSNSCTQTDTCQGGTCSGGNPVVCTALNQCHDPGTCNPGTGICTNPNKPNGASCDDGDACTQTDTCQAGACSGTNPVVCTAVDQCHVAGTCDTATGICSNPNRPNGTVCNDSNACTQTDTCQAGTCTGTNPVTCAPPDQCHNPGTCNPATGVCSNPNKANGSACNDGNACTLTDTCQAGACSGTNPVVCTPLDQCHLAGTCDTTSGLCSNPNKPNGAACTSGGQNGICEIGECAVCGNGVVEGLEECDDLNTTPCDSCSPTCRNESAITYTAGPGLNRAITDNGYTGTLASMTCVNVVVPNAGNGLVDYVCATLGANHTWIGDLTVKIVSPANTVVTLMSRPGAVESADNGVNGPPFGDDSNLNLGSLITWRTGGPNNSENMGNLIGDNLVVCANDGQCLFDPNRGSAAAGTLATFIGQAGAGTWRLCVGDSEPTDTGLVDQVRLIIQQ